MRRGELYAIAYRPLPMANTVPRAISTIDRERYGERSKRSDESQRSWQGSPGARGDSMLWAIWQDAARQLLSKHEATAKLTFQLLFSWPVEEHRLKAPACLEADGLLARRLPLDEYPTSEAAATFLASAFASPAARMVKGTRRLGSRLGDPVRRAGNTLGSPETSLMASCSPDWAPSNSRCSAS